jgi:hypothetical protein
MTREDMEKRIGWLLGSLGCILVSACGFAQDEGSEATGINTEAVSTEADVTAAIAQLLSGPVSRVQSRFDLMIGPVVSTVGTKVTRYIAFKDVQSGSQWWAISKSVIDYSKEQRSCATGKLIGYAMDNWTMTLAETDPAWKIGLTAVANENKVVFPRIMTLLRNAGGNWLAVLRNLSFKAILPGSLLFLSNSAYGQYLQNPMQKQYWNTVAHNMGCVIAPYTTMGVDVIVACVMYGADVLSDWCADHVQKVKDDYNSIINNENWCPGYVMTPGGFQKCPAP